MGAFFGSADCKAVSGFWVGKRLTTEGAECTETESRGDGLPEYWKESGEGLLASCADKGVPACFSSLLLENRISIQENGIKSRE